MTSVADDRLTATVLLAIADGLDIAGRRAIERREPEVARITNALALQLGLKGLTARDASEPTDEEVQRVARAICKADLQDVRAFGDEICCQFEGASRRREGGHNRPDDPGPLECCREDYEYAAECAINALRGTVAK